MLTGKIRVMFWIIEVALTGVILLYPTHLHYEYRAIESPYIFNYLPLFAATFITWIGLLLLLLFTIKSKTNINWEGLAVVTIFSIVFLGFWGILAPDRQNDGIYNVSSAGYIMATGSITPHANVGYLDFPGIHILAAGISQITGITILTSATVILLFLTILLAMMLYIFFAKMIENPRLASFAVLLAIQGNWTQSLFAFFWPRYLGLIFLAVFLVLLNRKVHPALDTQQNNIAMIVLLAAATMSYFVTSMAFSFILVGIYLVQRVSFNHTRIAESRNYHETIIDWLFIAIFLLIPLVWEIYNAVNFFGGIAHWIPNFLKDLSGGDIFNRITVIASRNIGGAVPLWANFTRWFWLLAIYGLGFALALYSLFHLRKLGSNEKVILGGLLGVMVVGFIGLLLSPGGFEGQRLLMYAPLFLVPLMMLYFSRLKGNIRHIVFIFLPVTFLALSFPTFLAHNSRINTDAYYSYDYASGEFMESNFGNGKGLYIYHFGDTSLPLFYEGVRDAAYFGMWGGVQDETELWQKANAVVANFNNSYGWNNLFIVSQRGMGTYQLIGVQLTDPGWNKLEQSLFDKNRIYDSMYVQIYEQE